MNHRFTKGLALLAALALVAVPLAAQEPTVDELIEKNLEAKGGKKAWEELETLRFSGTRTFGPQEAPFTLQWKAPDKLRIEFTLQGMTGVQAYDGETAWAVMPFMGKTEPERMSPEEAAMVKEEADVRGRLFNPEERGYEVEYVGEADVEGTPAYELELTSSEGTVTHLFLDKEYYVEIQETSERTVRGQTVESVTTYGDYKEVDGLLIPHSLEVETMVPGAQGQIPKQVITVEEVTLNADIPDETFEMPETAPSESEEMEDEMDMDEEDESGEEPPL